METKKHRQTVVVGVEKFMGNGYSFYVALNQFGPMID
jgi:hypothetical protein